MIAEFDRTERTKWFVDDCGNVFSISKWRGKVNKKGTVHKRGYVYIRTTNGNYQLHRLVASAFIPNPLNKPCVNHIDGIKANNNVSNLEWVTYKENHDHSIKNGFSRKLSKNEGNIKYSYKQCKEVLKRISSGMKYKDAGKKFGMPYSTVAHLARGSRRKII